MYDSDTALSVSGLRAILVRLSDFIDYNYIMTMACACSETFSGKLCHHQQAPFCTTPHMMSASSCCFTELSSAKICGKILILSEPSRSCSQTSRPCYVFSWPYSASAAQHSKPSVVWNIWRPILGQAWAMTVSVGWHWCWSIVMLTSMETVITKFATCFSGHKYEDGEHYGRWPKRPGELW